MFTIKVYHNNTLVGSFQAAGESTIEKRVAKMAKRLRLSVDELQFCY